MKYLYPVNIVVLFFLHMETSLETVTEHVSGPGGNGCLVQVSKENCNTRRLKALAKDNIFI